MSLTQTGTLTQPKKSSCEPWRADWHTCLKNLPNPLTPLTSFSRETASSTLLSSSWSQMSRCSMSEWMSSMSLQIKEKVQFRSPPTGSSPGNSQFKLFVPLRTQCVWFDGGRPDELGRYGSHRVPLLAAVLALEAQPKAVMFSEFPVLRRVQAVHPGVGEGPWGHRRLRRRWWRGPRWLNS